MEPIVGKFRTVVQKKRQNKEREGHPRQSERCGETMMPTDRGELVIELNTHKTHRHIHEQGHTHTEREREKELHKPQLQKRHTNMPTQTH